MRVVIDELRNIGYKIELKGDSIVWKWCGRNLANPNRIRELIAKVIQNKAQAMKELKKERLTPKKIDVFKGRISSQWIVVLPDLNKSGQFVAWNAGKLEPKGFGITQYEAIQSLRNFEEDI
jgi:hypothetical protein